MTIHQQHDITEPDRAVLIGKLYAVRKKRHGERGAGKKSSQNDHSFSDDTPPEPQPPEKTAEKIGKEQDYLIGLRYAGEKKAKGGDRKSMPHFEALAEGATRERLAEELGVSKATVERNATYAAAVNKIAEKAGREAKPGEKLERLFRPEAERNQKHSPGRPKKGRAICPTNKSGGKENARDESARTNEQAAKSVGMSRRNYEKAKA